MPKKKQATKSEKQAMAKSPAELTEEQLDEAQGGMPALLARLPSGVKADAAGAGREFKLVIDF